MIGTSANKKGTLPPLPSPPGIMVISEASPSCIQHNNIHHNRQRGIFISRIGAVVWNGNVAPAARNRNQPFTGHLLAGESKAVHWCFSFGGLRVCGSCIKNFTRFTELTGYETRRAFGWCQCNLALIFPRPGPFLRFPQEHCIITACPPPSRAGLEQSLCVPTHETQIRYCSKQSTNNHFWTQRGSL